MTATGASSHSCHWGTEPQAEGQQDGAPSEALRPHDRNSIPETHGGRGEPTCASCLSSPQTPWHVCAHGHTH